MKKFFTTMLLVCFFVAGSYAQEDKLPDKAKLGFGKVQKVASYKHLAKVYKGFLLIRKTKDHPLYNERVLLPNQN